MALALVLFSETLREVTWRVRVEKHCFGERRQDLEYL